MESSGDVPFMGEFCSYAEARAVVLPVPLEKTTSYKKGSAWGPSAILNASQYVELYDIELDREIYNIGIHTLPSIAFESQWDIKKCHDVIAGEIKKILKDKQFPVLLGGEHSLTIPVINIFKEHFNDLSVLHIDAHADLRDSYEDSPYSHACVMRRIHDMGLKAASVGIRSISLEEAEFIKKQQKNIFYDRHIHIHGMPMEKILKVLSDSVYITLDVDAMRPGIMPAVGTPEPGGIGWYEMLSLLKDVFTNKNVVGFDIVELKPDDINFHTEFTAAKLAYKMIGYKFFC